MPKTLVVGYGMLCVVGLLFGSATAKPPSPNKKAQEQGQHLLRKGDAHAAEKSYEAATMAYKRAYDALVPVVRELAFRHPVKAKVVTVSEAREHMRRLIAEELPPAEARRQEAALKVFGLVPSDLDVENFMLTLLTEEVAGFFDPKTDAIFLLRRETAPRKGLLGRLFGPPEFDPDAEKLVVAHEMAHALVDQHFDLDALSNRARGDDDRALALAALAEGDATIVMFDDAYRQHGQTSFMSDIDPATLRAFFELAKGFLPMASGSSFRSAPAIFRETLLSPYLDGSLFVLELIRSGGWHAVDSMWKAPPTSTEQILHPEKARGDRDVPVDFDLALVGAELGPEWTRVGTGVWGQLQLSVWLDVATRAPEVAGWDGDRYVVWEGDGGRLAAVWRSQWDSTTDAGEAARAIAKARGLEEAAVPSSTYAASREHGETIERVEQIDLDVTWSRGFDAPTAAILLEAAKNARSFPK